MHGDSESGAFRKLYTRRHGIAIAIPTVPVAHDQIRLLLPNPKLDRVASHKSSLRAFLSSAILGVHAFNAKGLVQHSLGQRPQEPGKHEVSLANGHIRPERDGLNVAVGQTESFREFPGALPLATLSTAHGQQEISNCPSPYHGELP